MEQSSGQISAKLARPPDGGEGRLITLPDGGKDRLSALPDEVLVLILECLDTTAEAVRTSVLARRWPRLWPLLSKVRFHLRPDGDRIRELLDVPDAPQLSYISVTTKGAAADSATAWLPAAARRLAGGLYYRNMAPDVQSDGEDDDVGNVELPCFESATTLNLCYLGLALPSLGVFTRLIDLSLTRVQFRGPCDLGNVVSSPRCPCLQKLSICYVSGLGNLSIHSESLLQLGLKVCDMSQVTIVSPILQKLSMYHNFHAIAVAADPSDPIANITAPQIVSLVWKDSYDTQYFHLGNLGQLRELQTRLVLVYGTQFHREYNRHSLRLLQRFQIIHCLHLQVIYDKDLSDYQYLLGDITVLPQVTFLQLELCNYGHAFGASLFHLLRMCIGLRKLLLVYDNMEEEHACPSECICVQSKKWRTNELVLGHLEDVRIIGLQGAEHEVAFVQRLLGWATVLKSLRITFDNMMTEGKIMEFRKALAGFSRPETCVQFDE